MKVQDGMADKQTWTQDEVYEFQREQEQSLIRNVALDSIILILAIILYESSDIKDFYNVYYTASFFGVMAFSFHIGFRFAFRSMYEDSAIALINKALNSNKSIDDEFYLNSLALITFQKLLESAV